MILEQKQKNELILPFLWPIANYLLHGPHQYFFFGNCKHLQCCCNSIPCQSAIWFQSAWKISLNFSNNVHVLVHLFSFSTTIYHFASFFMLVIYQGYSVTINQMPILNSRGLKGNSILWSFLFSVKILYVYLTTLLNPQSVMRCVNKIKTREEFCHLLHFAHFYAKTTKL